MTDYADADHDGPSNYNQRKIGRNNPFLKILLLHIRLPDLRRKPDTGISGICHMAYS